MPNQPIHCVIQLTPPGRGAVATLRVEGANAVEAVQAQFHARNGRPLAAYPVDRLVIGHFGGDKGEEVIVRRCADGAVEVHCHGGLAAVAMIEEALGAAGCQTVAWRDWVASSVLPTPKGTVPFLSTTPSARCPQKLGQSLKAAALKALADARTERTAAILLDQYHGALELALHEIQQAIDQGQTEAARQQIDAIRARADLGRHLVQPWRVVLAGRVNVGKSSLINALAGYGRSIVHATPGTTRDAVTVATAIDGWPVELCDTGGLRTGMDPIERAGIEIAQERIAQADLAILIFDRSQAWSAEDQTLVDQWPGALLVDNKSDLPSVSDDRPTELSISTVRAEGIQELLEAIARRLVPEPPPPGAAVPFTAEQVNVLDKLLTV
jgi:tRNA modification GTPase